MEGCQHNTMDVEYYGPNPQMGLLVPGGAARGRGDGAATSATSTSRRSCRKLFDSGRAWMDEHLFNGEYYRHEIRPPASADDIAPGLRERMGATDPTKPELQLADGCLVDQLVGQYLALGCPTRHPARSGPRRDHPAQHPEAQRLAGFSGHFNHMRSFVLGDESARADVQLSDAATGPSGRSRTSRR